MVSLPASTLAQYERFSLFNSPYPAHDRGRAVDLYPDRADPVAPSPVAGVVRDVRTVRAPDRPYAVESDHLVVVDVDADCLAASPGYEVTARVLHVDPAVDVGDEVAVGDSLGTTVRSGYFAPWVADHLHLGFRRREADPVRASGSLRVGADVAVAALPWDGTGTVVETGGTWVRLDEPTGATPGAWAGIEGAAGTALDGGLPHYAGGGALPSADGPLTLAGTRVGVASGRTATWDDVTVVANGTPITGLSCFLSRERGWGAKLVWRDHGLDAGDDVRVAVRR
jgi:hypothetical protein